jgi:CubicO group peptidase (beta-lactamase class C family)
MKIQSVALCGLLLGCQEGAPAPEGADLAGLVPDLGAAADQAPDGDLWAPVTRELENAVQSGLIPGGAALEIYNDKGLLYSRHAGALTVTTREQVASSSKWVTALTLLRLVDKGQMSLADTTSRYLTDQRTGKPWSGIKGSVTLRQLLSFTSGFPGDHDCVQGNQVGFAECVQMIYEIPDARMRQPGSTYIYGNIHMELAARMAEVATGKTWAQIFAEEIKRPLSLSVGTLYGAPNPNPAGSLGTTVVDYGKILAMVHGGGVAGGQRLLSAELIAEQRRDQFGPQTVIGFSPYTKFGYAYHYGLGAWRECEKPADAAACDQDLTVSSAGKFGWYPWLDSKNRYFGVFGMREGDAASMENINGATMPLKSKIRALVVEILKKDPPAIQRGG